MRGAVRALGAALRVEAAEGGGRAVDGGAAERVLRSCGGLLEGHFVLSSGRHSDRYVQVAAAFEHPRLGAELAAGLAAAVAAAGLRPSVVLGPALGAVIPGYELARALDCRSLFCERGPDGRFALRRGFVLEPGEPVLVCENTLTTGGSALEALAVARAAGGRPIGVAVVCDRMPDARSVFDIPYVALCRMELESWPAADCPLCRAGSVPVKPGSRPDPPAALRP